MKISDCLFLSNFLLFFQHTNNLHVGFIYPLVSVPDGFRASFFSDFDEMSEKDVTKDLIKKFYDIYTQPIRKDKLRKQMPIDVIKKTYAAYQFARQIKLQSLDVIKFIDYEILITESETKKRNYHHR